MDDKPSVLIVDDDASLSKTLCDILRAEGYAPVSAGEGQTALRRVEEEKPLVAVVDLRLPDMDGLRVMEEIKKRSPGTECIVLTGYASQASAIEAINLGAYSYVQKPYDVQQLLVTIRRAWEKGTADGALQDSEERYRELVENASDVIYTHDLEGHFTSSNPAGSRVYGYTVQEILHLNIAQIVDPEYLPVAQENIRRELEGLEESGPYELLTRRKDGEPVWVEVSTRLVSKDGVSVEIEGIARDITERKLAEQERERSLSRLRRTLEQTVYALAAAVEMRDSYTAGHQRRVADLATAIADEMGIPAERIRGIRMAGLIHDVGKIHIPAEILSKPTRLTEVEWSMIKAHPQAGYDILKDIEFPWPVARIVLQHHERVNGSGYPQGLSDKEILLEARILGVADVVEAMASHRPYRPAHAVEEALGEIRENRGILYDPQAVDACLEVIGKKILEFPAG
jgi:PAS domain S-box-containing protein/putative nucleotidyltransferase with HDIG domain